MTAATYLLATLNFLFATSTPLAYMIPGLSLIRKMMEFLPSDDHIHPGNAMPELVRMDGRLELATKQNTRGQMLRRQTKNALTSKAFFCCEA